MSNQKKKGLTLIEMVMTIVIVGVLAGGSMLYIRQVIYLWDFISFRSEVVSQARLSLGRMSRDIRQIRDANSIILANSTRLQFNDINNLNINYYWANNSLTRNSDVLSSGVSSFNFTYYNLTNFQIAIPLVSPQATNIRRINIRMNVVSGNQNKTLETQVWPRSFGGL
jgi:prepilin-type N-terminal cleavage/methylation domain-containing protein